MSSLKLSKLKTHAPKKSISVNASVGKTSSTAVPIDSKASIPDKPDKIDSRRNNKVPSKETVKLPSESGLEIHTIQDFTASDLSIIKMLEGDNYKEAYEDGRDKKFKEENIALKRDLKMKNNLVEKLMKENSDLRREMDELLSTLEDAKDKIDLKLSTSQQKIKELEEKIRALQRENNFLKEEAQKKQFNSHKKVTFTHLEDHAAKYYTETQEKVEVFYKQIQQKISEFMESNKEQYEAFNFNMNQPENNQKESIPKHSNEISLQNQIPNQNPSSSREPNQPSPKEPQSKSKHVALSARFSMPTSSSQAKNKLTSGPSAILERVSSTSTSNRRKRNLTLHDLGDLDPINQSENTGVATCNAAGNGPRKKSPKSTFFTPKTRSKMALKSNTCVTEGDK